MRMEGRAALQSLNMAAGTPNFRSLDTQECQPKRLQKKKKKQKRKMQDFKHDDEPRALLFGRITLFFFFFFALQLAYFIGEDCLSSLKAHRKKKDRDGIKMKTSVCVEEKRGMWVQERERERGFCVILPKRLVWCASPLLPVHIYINMKQANIREGEGGGGWRERSRSQKAISLCVGLQTVACIFPRPAVKAQIHDDDAAAGYRMALYSRGRHAPRLRPFYLSRACLSAAAAAAEALAAEQMPMCVHGSFGCCLVV